MRVLKVFYEEYVVLEALVPDQDPDARRDLHPEVSLAQLLAPPPYSRLYLAGTDLSQYDEEGGPLVGLSTLPQTSISPLLKALAGSVLWGRDGDRVLPKDILIAEWKPGSVVIAGVEAPPIELVLALEAAPTRQSLPALRTLLDVGYVVLYVEPAHHGIDVALFFRHPIVAQARDAMARLAPADERWFLAPFQRARGEHSFYFERWALEALPSWVEEPARTTT